MGKITIDAAYDISQLDPKDQILFYTIIKIREADSLYNFK